MSFEFDILNWLQTIHVPILDKIMVFSSALGNSGMIWICFTILLLIIPQTRKVGIAAAISLILELIFCNMLIKPLVARVRPYDINTAVELISKVPSDYSFPSGHTAASFAVTGALFFGKNKLWIPSLILSIVIAFSRLYLYVHYPTDVAAGIVMGILCGWAGNKLIMLGDKYVLHRSTWTDRRK